MKLLCAFSFLSLAVVVYGAPRIIGGSNAADGQYPYMVSLRRNSFHFCGGSIINKRWILTAAHCLIGLKNNSIEVVAGTVLLNGGNEQSYKSEYIVSHEDFNEPPYSNDPGLIRVDKDIEFNDKVQPVKLTNTDVYNAGHPVTFSGWGSTKLWGPSPNNLQEVFLNVFDQHTCKKEMSYLGDVINDGHICTFTKCGQGICHGDSGSALVADGVQIGIASFVSPCAVGKPDIFVRVYTFLDWIAEQQNKF